jgi:hypothetical protein
MPRTRVTAVTWNMGNASDEKVRADLVRLMYDADTLALQEAGDRGRLLTDYAKDRAIGLYRGDRTPGAASVPVLWRADAWHAMECWTVPLTKRSWAPEGVGPKWVKPKVVNLVRLRHRVTGEVIVAGSTHMPASLWAHLRALVGMSLVRRLAKVVDDLPDPCVLIGGDWNTKVGSRILRPLHRRGRLRSAQGRHPIATHGNRAIDDVWVRGIGGLLRSVRKTSSDHRAFKVTGTLR